MAEQNTVGLFSIQFLADFVFSANELPFTNKEIFDFDHKLSKIDQAYLSHDIERRLISKNEFLASFAISKAEQSSLTFKEAEEVYKQLLEDKKFDFIKSRLNKKNKLTEKEYEKLEFFNIARTFRQLNQKSFPILGLDLETIKKIHLSLTFGLDIFASHLSGFTVYRSGKLRNNDDIRVGQYIPAPAKTITGSVKELINWLQKDFNPTRVAAFHTALYAIHPFNNGNKRVCRILEHLLLRESGLNLKNLYSSSYYYHQEKLRYYKYLLSSLLKKNINFFTSFVLEALVISMISVIKSSIEAKRLEFIEKNTDRRDLRRLLKPLIKRRQLQFKNLFRYNKNKMARQTFVNNLSEAIKLDLISKREEGKATYYQLKFYCSEEKIYQEWLEAIQSHLSYIPNDIRLL